MKKVRNDRYYKLDDRHYSVLDVTEITGISRDNLRYYEKRGLIVSKREKNNYRYYTGEDIQILIKIQEFRELGFRIDEILLLRSMRYNDVERVKDKLLEKRGELEEEILKYQKMLARLDAETRMYLDKPHFFEETHLVRDLHVCREEEAVYQSMPLTRIFRYVHTDSGYEEREMLNGYLFTREHFLGCEGEKEPEYRYPKALRRIVRTNTIELLFCGFRAMEESCRTLDLKETGEIYVVPDVKFFEAGVLSDIYMIAE